MRFIIFFILISITYVAPAHAEEGYYVLVTPAMWNGIRVKAPKPVTATSPESVAPTPAELVAAREAEKLDALLPKLEEFATVVGLAGE